MRRATSAGARLPPGPNRECCALRRAWASRWSALPPSPNSRSNTMRGWISIGTGVVGVRHDDGVDVNARVAVVAAAEAALLRLERELERGQPRLAPELLGGDLIDGRAGLNARALGPLRMNAVQPGGGPARVVAVAIAERLGLLLREVAEHEDLVANRRERSERRRQLESRADGRRHPLILDDAVRHVDEPEAPRGLRRPSRPAPRAPAPSNRAAAARASRPVREETSGAAATSC